MREPLPTTSPCTRLILVEDDPVTRSMIANYFVREGFTVDEAASGGECRLLMKRTKPDLVFIDIHLPDGSGLTLAQEIRAESSVGIIFVTQRDSETDRIVGLELAGDDYVTKPVNLRELLARARALLRRRQIDRVSSPARSSIILLGPWLLDLTRRELAERDGMAIRVTRAEFDLLAALAEADGRPLSRDYLIEVVSNRSLGGDPRTVDSLVARLRRKLVTADGVSLIVTVPGIGYKLGVKTEAMS